MPFNGAVEFRRWQNDKIQDIQREIAALTEDELVSKSADAIVSELVRRYDLPPLVMVDRRPHIDINDGIVAFELVPQETNALALAMKGAYWRGDWTDFSRRVSYREEDATIRVSTRIETHDDVAEIERTVKELIQHINSVIRVNVNGNQTTFGEYVRDFAVPLVSQRQEQVRENRGAEDALRQQLRDMGYSVRERDDAVRPINVRVKQEISTLREPTQAHTDASDQTMHPDSVERIVRLIDQAGRGFETAPQVYRRLGEEDLRTVILGYLNAVFESDVAKGEVFSKSGKTDIYFNNPGGGVLIAECKEWPGPAGYPGVMKQLFDYLTVRHAYGVVVIFSTNRGFSDVVDAAEVQVRRHPSLRGAVERLGDTYFVSHHTHPDDDRRTVILHHLFFNLYTEAVNRRGPRTKSAGAGTGKGTAGD